MLRAVHIVPAPMKLHNIPRVCSLYPKVPFVFTPSDGDLGKYSPFLICVPPEPPSSLLRSPCPGRHSLRLSLLVILVLSPV